LLYYTRQSSSFPPLVLQNLELLESIGRPVLALASKLGPSHCGEMFIAVFQDASLRQD